MATNNFLFKDSNDLRELVELNDFLRGLYKEDSSMKFPSIVVVGDQSHGKTSLIENITNLNLPRGTGIQTRVPMEIQLRNSMTPHYTIQYRPRGESAYRTVEFNEETLEEKLRSIQREVTGNDVDIAEDTIILTIERPDLLPLTITDLPGFIVQRIDDDPKSSSNEEIALVMKNLYTKFISQEQNYVVCVLNAANDIENAQVLKLCLELDVNRTRTIVVVTKIDLRTSAGFENYRKAANKFKIRKMFFTRSKTDEERIARLSSDKVRENERKYIAGHKELSKFPDDQKGVVALRNYLVELQKEMIIPNIMANYTKIIDLLKEKIAEQKVIGQTIERPSESKQFIINKLKSIFDEIKELYYNLYTTTQSDNYFIQNHGAAEYGTFEAIMSSKKLKVVYTVSEYEGQNQITFQSGLKEVIYVEVMTKKTEENPKRVRENKNIDLEMPEPIVIPKQDFTITMRFLADKDFMFFRERIAQLFGNFRLQYSLDYFISEQFVQIYENHERAINTTNSLPDRDFSQLAENILFKDIVPKLTYEVETFRDAAIKFAHMIFIVRINAQFRNYPNLRALLTRHIEKKLAPIVLNVNEVIEVLLENSFKISTTDTMYTYKVDYLKKLFKEGGVQGGNDFLKIVCGEIDFGALRELYSNNKRVFKNAIRVWAYISNVFPPLKDNLVKVIQNHLLQNPINDLDHELRAIFDDNFFSKQEEVARLMKPNPSLFKKQEALQAEIQRMVEALTRIKNMPNKYPNLQREFDFLQEGNIEEVLSTVPVKTEEQAQVPSAQKPDSNQSFSQKKADTTFVKPSAKEPAKPTEDEKSRRVSNQQFA